MSWLQSLPDYAYCAELLLAMLIYWLPLEKKRRWPLWMLGGAGVLYLESVFAQPLFHRLGLHLWFFLVFFTLFALCRCSAKITVWEALYTVSCAYFTQHIASSVYLLLAQFGLLPEGAALLPFIYLALYTAVYIAAYLLFSRGLADRGHYEVSRQLSLLLAATAIFVVYLLSVFTKQLAEFMHVDTSNSSYQIMLGICQIYAMLVCLLTLAAQKLHLQEFRAWRVLEMNQSIWNQKKAQFQFSKENMELMNRKFHDMKHQIAAISRMDAASPRKDALVRELQNIVQAYGSYADTGSEALDTILMEKGLYCSQHGIEWKCVAEGSFLAFMDVVDLYTMIGNALDNAVESAERVKDSGKRFISAVIRQERGFALIQIRNYTEDTPLFRDGLPLTSKPDAQNHGYGLRSIRAIVEQYQGSMTVRAEDHIFTLDILIPLPA